MAKYLNSKAQTQQSKVAEQTQSDNHWAVSRYLGGLRFSHRLMGVDEADVWKKIEKLCELYETALTEEQGKSEKLARLLKSCSAKLKTYTDAEKRAEEDQPNG